jgi:dihydroxyacetone kinase
MRHVKHFMDDRSTLVTEAVEAQVALGDGKLARLDGFPAIKVVLRTDWDREQVAIVSGGGSGHEPSHAGFVGDGMLTAAVCGEVFASPSVDAILAGILAVTGPAGCLLIVKNYTGDRLNFGLAAEKARALGLEVEMVVVADDIAIAGAPQPRGIAGTLLVHKVAGHLARSGAPLAEVKAGAERVARSLVSIGLSLSSCTIPGRPADNRIGPGEVEMGLGIHGEPGAERLPFAPVSELAKAMVQRLEAALDARENTAPLALLINDLGGVPPIEMAAATRAVLAAMKSDVALVFGPHRLMTSLDMKGFSLSVLPLDAELASALVTPVGPRAWSVGRRPAKIAPLPLPAGVEIKGYPASSEPARRAIVERIAKTCVALEEELDALDAKIGDGDTGSTLATAARAILADLDALPFASASALCAALSERLSTVMGGSSGILLAIFTAAMGTAVGEPARWTPALREGAQRMQRYGGANPGDRTMLDALLPAIAALEAGGDLAAAAEAARAGAERTATMTKAKAGRASYVRADALQGVPDPGAVAVARVFSALATSSISTP